MTGQRGRVEWVDAARGMAIALVVVHHAAKRSVVAGSADWWVDLTEMLATVRMPLFFLVAGLFAARWASDRTSWPTLLRGKVLLFAWVYVVWLVLRWAWFVALPSGKESMPFADLVTRVAWPAGGWFIYALAIMFVIARLVHALPTPLVLVATAGVSIAFLADWVGVGNQAWDGLGTYTFFFLLGIKARTHVLRLSESVPRAVLVLVPVAWAALYLLCVGHDLETAPGVGFALRVAGITAGVCVALLLQHRSGLRALGRGTLPIYLTHQLLVVTVVSALGSVAAFDQHAVLTYGAPLLIGVTLLVLTYWLGRLAPRLGLGWLFATPRWLDRLAGGAPRPLETRVEVRV